MIKNRAVFQHKQRIESAISLMVSCNDDKLKSSLSCYICVLASGFIEMSVREYLRVYASNRMNKKQIGIVTTLLSNYRSMKSDTIVKLCKVFDSSLGHDIQSVLDSNQPARDAIDSVVARRHNIAHGGMDQITPVTISGYFKHIVKFFECMETYCM